jgi:hypothetical protein
MNIYRKMVLNLEAFLTLTMDRMQWSTSDSNRFTLEKVSNTSRARGVVGSRAGLDVMEKIEVC